MKPVYLCSVCGETTLPCVAQGHEVRRAFAPGRAEAPKPFPNITPNPDGSISGIETHPSGGMTLTGDGIELYRLLSLRMALSLQVNCGMSMSRGVTGLKAAKWLGIKARTAKQALAIVEGMIVELGKGTIVLQGKD